MSLDETLLWLVLSLVYMVAYSLWDRQDESDKAYQVLLLKEVYAYAGVALDVIVEVAKEYTEIYAEKCFKGGFKG